MRLKNIYFLPLAFLLFSAFRFDLQKKKKELHYHGISSHHSVLEEPYAFTVYIFHLAQYDSVFVKGQEVSSSFRMKYSVITDSVFYEYYKSGSLKHKAFLIHPKDLSTNHGLIRQYNRFRAFPVSDIFYYENGTVQEEHYRDINLNDSVYRSFSQEGVLTRYNTPDYWAEYYESGIIKRSYSELRPLYVKSGKYYMTNRLQTSYYENGVIRELRRDTLIRDVRVTEVQDYYPNGILMRKAFIRNGLNYVELTEYKPDGSLKKRTAFSAPDPGEPDFDIDMEVLDMSSDKPAVWIWAEERAQYPGSIGNGKFNEELKKKVDPLISKLKLYGNYQLKLLIDRDGSCRLVWLNGMNSKEFETELKKILIELGNWKPGHINGLKVKEYFTLHFEIK